MSRRTKKDAQITRERILDMAEVEFHRRGVSRTSLLDIARAAGVTRGAVYWHFQDKADLFNAMMNRVTLPLEHEINRSGDPTLDDPLAQIRSSFLAALRSTVTDPQARRVFEIALHKVEYVDELQAVRDRRLNGLRGRVLQIERGLRRAGKVGALSSGVPARAAAIGLHSLIDGLIQNWMLDPESFDLRRVGQQTIDAYLRGLREPATPT
ncbi:MAG: TetR family transcriptional regulator [Proteobacteria bacterium]|nr:TetR family transcriptional regulator [Burkholderiales bacterium]